MTDLRKAAEQALKRLERSESELHKARAELRQALAEQLEEFAKLIRADERESCAKVCDDWPNGRDDVYLIGQAIRARGEK